ncbi:MAG: acetyltransferase, family [Thermoleophilia bacterium]|nr:acetyltransferase, family [Thermoleophilia bacterium]
MPRWSRPPAGDREGGFAIFWGMETDRDTPPASDELTFDRIDSAATHPLRMQILRPGRPESECEFPGDDDPETFHAGAFLAGELVAVASMYREARPVDAPGGVAPGGDHEAGTAWRLRGMATSPQVRRRGAGARALEACEDHARARGGTLAWCNARTPAIAFYEAQGWTRFGEEFEIPTAGPHFVMEKRLD